MILICKNASLSPKDAFCHDCFNWFYGRRIFNFVNVYTPFRFHLSLEKGTTIHLNKLEDPSSMDALILPWLK